MHFGWNIGKAFGKSRLQTATFIKRVFAHTLRDSEISTIERKMSHAESECKIKQHRKLHNKEATFYFDQSNEPLSYVVAEQTISFVLYSQPYGINISLYILPINFYCEYNDGHNQLLVY